MAIDNTAIAVAVASISAQTVLAAIGINAEPVQFFMGAFLAIFAGVVINFFMPVKRRRHVILAMSAAAIASTFGAILHPSVMSSYPLVAVMIIWGGSSSFIANLVIKIGTEAEERSEKLLDRVIGKSDD